MTRRPRSDTLGPITLLEDAVHRLRTAPLSVIAPYYVGALPFVMALLFFWTDMSRSAFAEGRLLPGSVVVAVMFVWMKVWQSRFAGALHAHITGDVASHGRKFAWIRMAAAQSYHHGLGLIALPLSFIAVVPFPWVYAYYQNITVLGAIEDRDLTAEARRLASQWPLQNLAVMWLVSPFLLIIGMVLFGLIAPLTQSIGPGWAQAGIYVYLGLFFLLVLPLSPLGCVIAVNITAAISLVPALMNMWLGIETPLTMTMATTDNTFIAIVCCIAYLVMDPVVKTSYVLRCFYGRSRRTGVDLMVSLKRIRNAAATRGATLLIALCAMWPQDAAAQSGVDPQQLDEAIAVTLQDREYAWRLPRDVDFDNPMSNGLSLYVESVLKTIAERFEGVGEFFRKILRWFEERFSGGRPGGSWASGISATGLRVFLLAAAGILVAVLGTFLIRRWLRTRHQTMDAIAESVPAQPDLEDENLTADVLPESEWLALAADLLARGESRLAIRALFLAVLARLASDGLIRVAKYKSNFDYARELARRAHVVPESISAFKRLVGIFESTWYGVHAPTEAMVAEFRRGLESVRISA